MDSVRGMRQIDINKLELKFVVFPAIAPPTDNEKATNFKS